MIQTKKASTKQQREIEKKEGTEVYAKCYRCKTLMPLEQLHSCGRCDTYSCNECDHAIDWAACKCGLAEIADDIAATGTFDHFKYRAAEELALSTHPRT